MRRFDMVLASGVLAIISLSSPAFAQAPAPAAGPYKVLKTVKVSAIQPNQPTPHLQIPLPAVPVLHLQRPRSHAHPQRKSSATEERRHPRFSLPVEPRPHRPRSSAPQRSNSTHRRKTT